MSSATSFLGALRVREVQCTNIWHNHSKFIIFQREASKSFITANLQSFNKILHGASALYQPAMDQDSGEIIFPDTEEYGDFLSEDAWYEWQLHFMDDPDTQNFPLENKDFTVQESRHTAADDEDLQQQKTDSASGQIGRSFRISFRSDRYVFMSEFRSDKKVFD